MLASFRIFFQYKYLLYVLVVRDVKTKYRRSVLGVLWSMLNPLFMMIITAMVFSQVFRFDIENYILYLLIGQVVFTFFRESTDFAMRSICDNGSLIRKVYVPKYLFPMSRVISSCVNLLFTIPAIFVMMIYTGQWPTWRIVSFFLPLALMLVFCLGLGLFLSAVAVYFRDMMHLYKVLMSGLTYATPIFYPEVIVPPQYHWLLKCNPVYYYLKSIRDVVYAGGLPDLHTLAICAGLAAVMLIIGLVVFRRLQNHFILAI